MGRFWQHYRRASLIRRYLVGGDDNGVSCSGQGRRRRSTRPGDRHVGRRPDRFAGAAVDRLPTPAAPHHLAQQPGRVGRPQVQPTAVGGPADGVVHHHPDLRAVRVHLGRQPAYRQRPRPRDRWPIPRTTSSSSACSCCSSRAAWRACCPTTSPVRPPCASPDLVRAGRRAPDGRLRPVRTHRLSARRHLAPHLRPGRHAVGPDAPHDDRRRRLLHPVRDHAQPRGPQGDG